jgi:hypothetical protein
VIEIKPKRGTVLIAIESGKMQLKDGKEFLFIKGRTRIRAGSEPAELNPQFFSEADVEFDIEDATREPGRKRGERD